MRISHSRIISALLVLTFSCQDISWANQDTLQAELRITRDDFKLAFDVACKVDKAKKIAELIDERAPEMTIEKIRALERSRADALKGVSFLKSGHKDEVLMQIGADPGVVLRYCLKDIGVSVPSGFISAEYWGLDTDYKDRKLSRQLILTRTLQGKLIINTKALPDAAALSWRTSSSGASPNGPSLYTHNFKRSRNPEVPPKVMRLMQELKALRPREKLDLLLQAHELDPKNIVVMNNIAQTCLTLRRYREAKEWANKSIQIAQNLPSQYRDFAIHNQSVAYGILSKLYLTLGRPQEALKAADEHIRLAPRGPIGYGQKASALLALGRPQEALKEADESIRLAPRDPIGYGQKASILLALGRPQEALKAADEHIRLAPRNPIGYGQKASILLALGRPQEALKAADEHIRLAPRGSIGYGQKASILLALRLKIFILEGKEEAEKFSQEQLKILSNQASQLEYYPSLLMSWLRRVADLTSQKVPRPHLFSDKRKEHILERHTLISGRFSGRGDAGLFPPNLNKEQITKLLSLTLEYAASMRELPEGKELEWWPEEVFIAYLHNTVSKELMRIEIIGDERGEVITAYPVLGPGVSYHNGLMPLPIDRQLLSTHIPLIWNKNSRQPINMRIGDSHYGFISMLNNPLLSGLHPIEREQLVWLITTEGEPCFESKEYFYYKYTVPFSAYRERLPVSTIFLKVGKESFDALDISDSVTEENRNVPSSQLTTGDVLPRDTPRTSTSGASPDGMSLYTPFVADEDEAILKKSMTELFTDIRALLDLFDRRTEPTKDSEKIEREVAVISGGLPAKAEALGAIRFSDAFKNNAARILEEKEEGETDLDVIKEKAISNIAVQTIFSRQETIRPPK